MESNRVRIGFILLVAITATGGIARLCHAQPDSDPLFRPGLLAVGISAGGTAFTDFQRGQARTGGLDMDRRVTAQTTVALAGTLMYWVASTWGVRIHASYAPSRFIVVPDAAAASGGAGSEPSPFAPLAVVMADMNMIFRAPVVFGRVAPYGILGGGFVDYRAQPEASMPLPVEARDAFADGDIRRFAGVIGVGAVVPLQRHDFFLTFELTDHLTRSPVADAAPGPIEEAPGLFVDPEGDREETGVTNTIRLMLGVTIPLNR